RPISGCEPGQTEGCDPAAAAAQENYDTERAYTPDYAGIAAFTFGGIVAPEWMLAGLARDGIRDGLGVAASTQSTPLAMGPVQAFQGFPQATPGSDLNARVWDLHGLLNPFAQNSRTTSIVRAVKPDGTYVDVV